MEEYFEILRECGCSEEVVGYHRKYNKTLDSLIKDWEGQVVYFTTQNKIEKSAQKCIEVIEKLKGHKNKKRLDIINKVLGSKQNYY